MVEPRSTAKWAVGLALMLGMSTMACAQQKTLYLGMNGGDMERTFTQHVFPVFEKQHNVKIVVVPGGSSDILAKAQAFRDKPQMHVMFLDDGVMQRAATMGLCEKMEDTPVMKELHPNARMDDGLAVGFTIGLTGLGYNKRMYEKQGWQPPTSWKDLADPKVKNKVVFQSASNSTFGLHAFLLYNRILGGDESNVEPGFKAWRDTIGPNVLEYIPSSAKLAEMIQTDEAAVFPINVTGVQRLQKRGVPVEFVAPAEGTGMLMVAECVIANNSEPELAHQLAQFLLSAQAQSLALENGSQIPSNLTVKAVDPEIQAYLAMNQDFQKTATVFDWALINANRQAWNARWNRTIER
ncbi:ABC transporter substrate-binding protein [Bordetella sp. BOR01]|nr:ABC transporter substrate-binding protein [Bordetella sp. BOR01]